MSQTVELAAPARQAPEPKCVAHRGARDLTDLVEVVMARRFGVEYQPIVDARTGAVVAYEALSRFFDPAGNAIPPAAVFARLHEDPALLLHVELEMKRLQLAHAPPGALHVNVDPDSFALAGARAGNEFVRLFTSGRPGGIVVEIIENISVSDASLGRAMQRELQQAGVAVALDDVGAPDALLSLEMLKGAEVVKLDRSWPQRAHLADDRAILDCLCGLSARLGARTVLEGVERTEDLGLARELGIACVQGFLHRDRFITVRTS